MAVIGAGTAGLAAYRTARAAGTNAVIIEGGAYGTTCARVGCMPSKLLIAAAEAAHAVHRAPGFGVHVDGSLRVDGREVMARVRRERDRFVSFVLEGVENIPAGDRIRGMAKFVDPHTLDIDGRALTARSIVIATGSRPTVPPILQGLGDRLVVNDDVFDWHDLPRSVAVFGPGVIGLEIGQALARLGVRVVVLGRGGRLGPITDPEVHLAAAKYFAQEFTLDVDAHVTRVERVGDEVEIDYRGPDGQSRCERFEYVLAATGRVPNVDNLGLESLGLERDKRGVPAYDKSTMQMGATSIFMAGDVGDYMPVLHAAADEGRIAERQRGGIPERESGTAPRAAGRGLHRPADRDRGRWLCRDQGARARGRRGLVRGSGTLARDAAQSRQPPRVCESRERAIPRGRDGGAGRGAHRPPALLGPAGRHDGVADAGDALLSPGGRGRPSHGAARPGSADKGQTTC